MAPPLPRQLLFYLDEGGRAPFRAWLQALRDRKARAVVEKRLTRVQLGNYGDSKGVGGGVIELRIDFGPGYRIYLANDGDKIIILLCGGDKSTQESDIRDAQRYWAHYQHQP